MTLCRFKPERQKCNNLTYNFTSYLLSSDIIKTNIKQIYSKGVLRLASVGILGKVREPGVGKLDWHGNTGFEKNNSFKIHCVGFFLNFFEISTVLLV